MTISYADTISEGQGVTIFLKLLFRWKGSLYKLLYVDLLIYLAGYYFINFIYRFTLPEEHKRVFEEIVKFSDGIKNNIPISFVLGFFVAGVISRWFQMYLTIPWLNRMAFLVEGQVVGNGPEESRKIRLTLMRYMNLAWILLMRRVSDQIAIRFRQNTVAGSEESSVRDIFVNFNRDRKVQTTYRKIITDSEIRAFENIAAQNYAKNKTKYQPEYWVPLQWASRLLKKAFIHGYISDPRTLNGIIDEVDVLRGQMQSLQIISNIMIPLVYTQVVIIAVYSYFLCQLFSSQFVDVNAKVPGHEVDFYVPIFTIFQFLFLMGWLKVAMCVMNPFGDDDEDFQTSEILDYNLDTSFRSSASYDDMFPEYLEPAVMKFRKQEGHEVDHLNVFMEEIDGDLEEIDPPNIEDDVKALEMQLGRLEKLRRLLCCYSDAIPFRFPSRINSPRNGTTPKCKTFFRTPGKVEEGDPNTVMELCPPDDANDKGAIVL